MESLKEVHLRRGENKSIAAGKGQRAQGGFFQRHLFFNKAEV